MSAETLTILTHDARDGLVWRESVHALKNLHHPVSAWETDTLSPTNVRRMFALPPERSGLAAHPSLFFSVNFHGLDKHGETAAAFREHGVPVAVWCVDNPWNLLSGLRTDFWKDLRLFVTDPGFIPGLKAHGARYVSFLPLATDPETFSLPRTVGGTADGTPPIVFVGRSAFPDKERFFVGQSVPEETLQEALSRLLTGERPDFFWWLNALKGASGDTPLWPGSAARRASLGAEESSLAWRAACLAAAASSGLTIHGDTGWTEQFSPAQKEPRPRLCPPLDYYTQLAAVYARAPYSLNMMSFLLPQGLNQRHFDVWVAGGFCLMDDCPGLELFPRELTAPVTFNTPSAIPDLVRHFNKNGIEKQSLAASWRKLILAEHTYAIRMQNMLATIFS
ncbi:DUF3880 domain-containing protein [Desulfovibrio sp. OttesenSCG-928-O18]|nr:DUF3880 domain-containing protein [Desulfovibrio sp. OttesenSCG-928-O18]